MKSYFKFIIILKQIVITASKNVILQNPDDVMIFIKKILGTNNLKTFILNKGILRY